MKQKYGILAISLCLILCIVNWLGIGYASSSSAISDLRDELETIYGREYTGKETKIGKEDMVFSVKPKTFFFTNWNLRHALSMPYKYECKVIITNFTHENVLTIHTITYEGIDPMGKAHSTDRAHLILASRHEADTIKNVE